MDQPRRDSRQQNRITLRGLSQPTFATKSAHRIISLPRSKRVAFGAKQTSSGRYDRLVWSRSTLSRHRHSAKTLSARETNDGMTRKPQSLGTAATSQRTTAQNDALAGGATSY
jgi:hypothetical protein